MDGRSGSNHSVDAVADLHRLGGTEMSIKKNDVIQINESIPDWTGCLMIVREVKDWGVMAGMRVPMQGTTYLRVKHDQYERIGTAVFVERGDDDDE